ncbi:MAG: DUF6794 domain-containing protein [Akkermansiaceae bacterium]
MKMLLTILLSFLTFTVGHAQVAKSPEAEEQVTIPSTLAEAHQELERLLPKEELAKIDAMKMEDEMGELHFGIGMVLRNSWGLWGDSPMAKHMQSLGFIHPDHMSGVILETFWCKRHGKDLRIKERVALYAALRKENKWPGDEVVDPDDKSIVDWNLAFGGEGRPHRMIYIGKSRKTGRWLAFENPTGVYIPGKDLLKRIEGRKKVDRLDPFSE